MDFKIFETGHNGLKFGIEEDLPEVGCYLLVFENGKSIKDYLQNDVLMCKEIAFQDYSIPIDAWKAKEK